IRLDNPNSKLKLEARSKESPLEVVAMLSATMPSVESQSTPVPNISELSSKLHRGALSSRNHAGRLCLR
ncbi:hypothetical protein PanWU01x14_354690, partial [Parasponia andersonii]